jgi:hypothetical protein
LWSINIFYDYFATLPDWRVVMQWGLNLLA